MCVFVWFCTSSDHEEKRFSPSLLRRPKVTASAAQSSRAAKERHEASTHFTMRPPWVSGGGPQETFHYLLRVFQDQIVLLALSRGSCSHGGEPCDKQLPSFRPPPLSPSRLLIFPACKQFPTAVKGKQCAARKTVPASALNSIPGYYTCAAQS